MFLLIVFIIVFILVLIKCYREADLIDDIIPFVIGFLIALLSLIPATVINCFTCAVLERNPNNIYHEIKDTSIYSLETNSNIYGSFILGCGDIDEDIGYYYYEKDENDLYSLKSIDSRVCKLKLDDSISPCIRRDYKKYKNSFLNFLFNLGFHDTVIIVPTTAVKRVYNGMIGGK